MAPSIEQLMPTREAMITAFRLSQKPPRVSWMWAKGVWHYFTHKMPDIHDDEVWIEVVWERKVEDVSPLP